MEKLITLSVIIPVYNKEAYIGETLESLMKQSFIDSEILIINDGSQDNSLEICKQYQKRCDRIKIINQENKGASAARNIGIQNARGKYIIMMDADDTIMPEMHRKMTEMLEKFSADVAFCGYNVWLKGQYISHSLDYPAQCLMNREFIEKELIPNSIGIQRRGNSIDGHTTMMIRRSILIENNIRYNEMHKKEEDKPFIITCLKYVNNVVFSKECFYNYIKRDVSLLHTYSKRFDNILENFSLYESLFEGDYNFLNSESIRYRIATMEDCILNVLVHKKDVGNVKEEVMDILTKPQCKQWFEKYFGGGQLHRRIKEAYVDNNVKKVYSIYMKKFFPLRIKLFIRNMVKR